MSLPHNQKLQAFPAAQAITDTEEGKNGCQNTATVDKGVALKASQIIQFRTAMAKLFQNYRNRIIFYNYNATVTSDPPSTEEKICLTVYQNMKVIPLTVKNCDVTAFSLSLVVYDFLRNNFTVKDCQGNIIEAAKHHFLRPGEEYKLNIHFYADHAGFYEQLLVFIFECEQDTQFEIMRLLEVTYQTCHNESRPREITHLQNYDQMKWTNRNLRGTLLLQSVMFMKKYPLPGDIHNFKKADRKLHRTPLNWENYAHRFHLLLHLEEFQQQLEIEQFNQHKVFLSRHNRSNDVLIVKIQHDSGHLKKVLCGNWVTVSPTYLLKEKCWTGVVEQVHIENVYIKFEAIQSDFREDVEYNVEFHIRRNHIRTEHRAIDQAVLYNLQEVLFPTGQSSSPCLDLQRLSETINNTQQCTAIQHILANSARPAPYLVFGPPGTGKTQTLVAAIKEIVKTQGPRCKILVCAPSNNATDHLCEKILDELPSVQGICRLYAINFPVSKILQNNKLKNFCNLDLVSETLGMPSRQMIMNFKIVVTTMNNVGRLVTGGVPRSHYNYIFMDEAGQARETESLISIGGIMDPQTCQLVLAGDPKQLGPVIHCRTAQAHGLGVSLLERLMRDFDLYKPHETDGSNQRFVTKLLKNYRSNPTILRIPNELFYEGELQPCVRSESSVYCRWELLPKKGIPLIFHGVAGAEERESNSPSVYNMAEVEVLKQYLKSLISFHRKRGVHKIEPEEIGIITPYRKQVSKIQNALQTDKDLIKENLENVVVGTVEQFQGNEFNVILVSTVRSNPKLTAECQKITLGFVRNEKRFNVAITRARALLIVLGDPRVLETNEMWNTFIQYCSETGAYRGITLSDAEKNEDLLTVIQTPPDEQCSSDSWSLRDQQS